MLNVVIDLSHHNDPVDFAQAAGGGLLGVVHKATEGAQDSDPRYAERRPQAEAAGLLWGAYHFGSGDDGLAQAQHFLAVVGPPAGVLLVLDFENPPPGYTTMRVAQAEAFVQAVQQATGRYPGLYATYDYLLTTGAAYSPVLANCWLWLADYNEVAEPPVPPAWPTWTMWQYTDGTQGNEPRAAPGIAPPCDRDQFNGELPGLHALWGVAEPAA